MIQPPPYDPNWQLRKTQFYKSPPVTGQYSQNQYSKGQQQQVPYNRDRQNPRTPNRLNIYVSYVETEAIMIINVNLQLILCNECRKHSNFLTICMRLIRIRNGLKVMTTMIKNSLFNKGGS